MANLKIYNRFTGKWEEIKIDSRIKMIKNRIVLPAKLNSVNIGITEFNPADDGLMVFKNGSLLSENVHYIFNSGTLQIYSIDGSQWGVGTEFVFVVLKNVQRDIPSADGSLIQNGSITDEKLAEGIKIGTALVDNKGTIYANLKDRLLNVDNKIEILEKSKVNVANVIEYGAKGDGITDDRQAFLNALNYLKTKGGGVLFIPPTTEKYVVSDQIEWDETYGHIMIMGVGRASHVYLSKRTQNCHLFGAIGSDENEENWIPSVIFKDLQLSTFTTPGTFSDNDNCIGISKAKNILIENVYVSYSRWKGISIQQYTKNITLKNVHTENCLKYGFGVEFSTVSDIKVINCVSNNNQEQGVLFTNAGDPLPLKGVIIEGLTVYNNKFEGIGLSGLDGGFVSGVQSYNNSSEGIKTYNCTNTYVKGICYNNGLAGVRTVLGSSNVFEVDSRNNSLNDINKRGNFFIESTPNTKLINCKGNMGVRSITNWSDNCTFINCDLYGTTNEALFTEEAKFTEGVILHSSGKKISYANSVPTIGSFNRGDIVFNMTPTAGGYVGWVCVSEGKAHLTSIGNLTLGSNQITNVTNISTWSVGDRIQGNGIPFGAIITSINGTTITMNVVATASGSQNLYDAVFKGFGNISL